MGSVYAATSAKGRALAIKFLHESLSDDPEAVARFEREAQNCRRIRSEHVARIVGAGDTDGTYWIIYQRVGGEMLAARLRRERVLERDAALRIGEQMLLGLEAAHGVGVVHRDIKPVNVMLEPTAAGERVCILDFGASKFRTPGASSSGGDVLTSATATLGTLNYMAPEQIGGAARADARADLYAVGVIAFRLLSGTLPFVGTSQKVMFAKMNARARSLAQATGVTWPAEVERLLERALAREREDRFGSAREMREAWTTTVGGSRMPDVASLREALGDEASAGESGFEGETISDR